MSDPRVSVVDERLSRIGKVIAVTSGKGGVGKSVFASSLALSLSRKGFKVGLLDLDFTSPSTHVILGAEDAFPVEDMGIIPPLVHGIRYMSIVHYTKDHPTPLRGIDVSNIFVEILAVTKWGSLDFLVLDLPPGIGDLVLDVIRLIKGVNFLVLTTPSKIAFQTVRKLLLMLKEEESTVLGVVENMKLQSSWFIRERLKKLGVPYLGNIVYDPGLEEALSDACKLFKTGFMKDLERIIYENPEITTV